MKIQLKFRKKTSKTPRLKLKFPLGSLYQLSFDESCLFNSLNKSPSDTESARLFTLHANLIISFVSLILNRLVQTQWNRNLIQYSQNFQRIFSGWNHWSFDKIFRGLIVITIFSSANTLIFVKQVLKNSFMINNKLDNWVIWDDFTHHLFCDCNSCTMWYNSL